MNSVTLYSSYVLILATIHLFILTRQSEAFPISVTIPSFLPYLPNSLFTWGIGDAPKPLILDTRDKNSDQKRENKDKAEGNPSNEDWDWTILPPSVWTNLLTARDPEKYWLARKSVQLTEPSRTTKSSEPFRIAIAKPKTRKHRHRHSRKHPRHSQTKAVLSTIVQDQVQSTTTTEIPIVLKRTKLPRSRNPLCYFTALPCAD
ncbi:hypothetical protein Ddc_16336 [Ditylenchus destructor]|nr:hypothetical protein Ddc_16336 [Ditylenchus destructor]